MGQYHWPVNLTKREFIHPHKFGDGLKLLEWGDSCSGTALGLVILLAASNGRGGGDLHVPTDHPESEALGRCIIGRWAGDEIAVLGDYAKRLDVPDHEELLDLWMDEDGFENHFVDISEHVLKVIDFDPYVRNARHESDGYNPPRGELYAGFKIEHASDLDLATGRITAV